MLVFNTFLDRSTHRIDASWKAHREDLHAPQCIVCNPELGDTQTVGGPWSVSGPRKLAHGAASSKYGFSEMPPPLLPL